MDNPYRCLKSNHSFLFCLFAVTTLFATATTVEALATEQDNERLELQELLISGSHEKLESRLQAHQRAYLEGKESDQSIGSAIQSFATSRPEMASALDKWVKVSPNSAWAHVARAAYLENRGWAARGNRYSRNTASKQFASMNDYFEAATTEARKAIAIDSTLSVPYAQLLSMAKSGQTAPKKRKLLFTDAIKRNPHSYLIRYEYLFGLQPKWGGVQEDMDSVLAALIVDARSNKHLSPLKGFGYFTRAEQAYASKEYELAVNLYGRALDYGKEALYLVGRSRAQAKMGNLDAALADLDSAVDVYPQGIFARLKRAEIHIQRKEYDQANAELTVLLKMDPLDPDLLHARARLNKARGQPDAALEDYRQSLTLAPDSAWTYARMGDLEKGRGDFRAASDLYQKAAELHPEKSEYWYSLAGSLYRLKECTVRYPLVRFMKVCADRRDSDCTKDRVAWVERTYQFVRSNPKCSQATDDTPPAH